MKCEEIKLDNRDYLKKLIHPYLLKAIYENIKESEYLKSFIIDQKNVNTWHIYSDYCLDDKKKPNNVMTFSIIALKDKRDFELVSSVLKVIKKSDSKKSSKTNQNFLGFISLLPIFNISILLPDNRNFTKAFKLDEINYLNMRYESLESYYHKLQSFPTLGNDFSGYIKDLKYIRSKFKNKSISLGKFRDMEIITSTITAISTLISSLHSNKKLKFLWISDRDSLITFEQAKLSFPIIFTMIYASFNSFSQSKNEISFYQHKGNGEPELDHFNRIPDAIAAALADMTDKAVSKEKFIIVIEEYLTNKSKNHITRIYFDENKYGLNTIYFNKKKPSV